ncbi:hypothetical protein OG352_06260 [Streptomyces sp. NBC_01485]|uniref:hypothetical protein n=1 Tax=Streptomyces sp. NBC_01485 TaxID=2903884 RepID=UPI002E34DEE2|nr:hypothetical protein [Streptomyces sp. NBC_01485]
MKIVKEVGEQPPTPGLHRRMAAELRPILAVGGAGASLWAGSCILLRRGWTLLGHHLDGRERWGALAFSGYVAVYACGHAPHIARFVVPGAAIVWCVAAWWVSPLPTPGVAGEEADEQAGGEPELTVDELASLVRKVARHRQGAHLADLLQEPELAGWAQPDLKAAVIDFGLPVEEFKLILAGRQRVRDGVRVRDLPPDPAVAAPASTPPEPPADPAPQPLPAQPPGTG